MSTISVIIPVYKAEKTIKRCLDSVISQTYTNLEILVVLLDSGDKTRDIVLSYNDPRIRLIMQREHTGPGGARNLGIQAAKGFYIGFVEADDYIETDFFENLCKAMNNEVDIVKGCILAHKNNLITTKENLKIGELVSFGEKQYSLKNGGTFDKLFRTSLIKDNRIKFTEGFLYEDNPFLLAAVFFARKIKIIDTAIYHHCWHGSNESRKQQLKNSVIPIAKNMLDFAKQHDFSKKQREIVRWKILISFANNFIDDREVYDSLQQLCGWNRLFFYARCKKILNQTNKNFKTFIKNI